MHAATIGRVGSRLILVGERWLCAACVFSMQNALTKTNNRTRQRFRFRNIVFRFCNILPKFFPRKKNSPLNVASPTCGALFALRFLFFSVYFALLLFVQVCPSTSSSSLSFLVFSLSFFLFRSSSKMHLPRASFHHLFCFYFIHRISRAALSNK